jgi:hypothetical protein
MAVYETVMQYGNSIRKDCHHENKVYGALCPVERN